VLLSSLFWEFLFRTCISPEGYIFLTFSRSLEALVGTGCADVAVVGVGSGAEWFVVSTLPLGFSGVLY
jgi:hypothetical protein